VGVRDVAVHLECGEAEKAATAERCSVDVDWQSYFELAKVPIRPVACSHKLHSHILSKRVMRITAGSVDIPVRTGSENLCCAGPGKRARSDEYINHHQNPVFA
jgi:hypothetical protein